MASLSQVINPAFYTVEVRDQYGRLITVLARPQQKQFSVYRNKPGSCQFKLDLYDSQAQPTYIQNSVNSIVFRRNSVPVFAGQISYHEPKVADSDKQKEVDITATGFMDLLDFRIITNDYPNFDAIHNKLPFTPTDCGQIAWSLIQYTQFPVPDSDDITATTTEMNGTFPIQQSFVSPGSADLKTLKLVIQNGSTFTGMVSSATTNSFTDNTNPFVANALVGGSVTITSGTDQGDTGIIASNTNNTITLFGNALTSTGTASSATTNTLTDNSNPWTAGALAGGTITITGGTDSGDTQTIISNTTNTLTIASTIAGTPASWETTPDGTSTYSISYSINVGLTTSATGGLNTQYSGTATQPATNNTLTDANANFPTPNGLTGGTIQITAGLDQGDAQSVVSNTAHSVTISGNWQFTPNTSSAYQIQVPTNFSGNSTLTDTTKTGGNAWIPNCFAGQALSITTGTDNGDALTIISNTSNTLTMNGAFQVTPDGTSTYSIISGLSGSWAIEPDTTSTYQIIPAVPETVGNLIVKILNNGANNTPTGSVVPNSTVTIPLGGSSPLPTALEWYEIDYSTVTNPVQLIQNEVYWLQLSLDTAQTAGNVVSVQVLSTDFYPPGMATSTGNPNLFSSDQDIQFFVLLNDNSYQQTKNTYLGIQEGIIQPSFNLAPTFDQYKHVKSAIEDLSTLYNGVDFAIVVVVDPVTNYMAKFFNVYYPGIGSQNQALNFSYPGNIKKMEKPKDGTKLINQVYMRGQGSGTAQVVGIAQDNVSIYIYGLRQIDQSQPDIANPDTVDLQAQEYVRLNNLPSDLPAIVLDGNLPPAYGSYGIGDWITISVTDTRAPILDFTQAYRIEEIDVSIDDDGVEEIKVTGDNV